MAITNATFVIERVLNAPTSQVFSAFTSRTAKSRWFKTPSEVEILDRELDFQVGGKERFRGR